MTHEEIAAKLREAIRRRGQGSRSRTPQVRISPQYAGGRSERLAERVRGGLPQTVMLTRPGEGGVPVPVLLWDLGRFDLGELGV